MVKNENLCVSTAIITAFVSATALFLFNAFPLHNVMGTTPSTTTMWWGAQAFYYFVIVFGLALGCEYLMFRCMK